MERLSEYFYLYEMLRSQIAARHGIDNRPDYQQLINLTRLAAVLEDARAVLDSPIHISSGLRQPRLNELIGGSKKSRHKFGLAADINSDYGTAQEVFDKLSQSDVKYDKIIIEYGSWVHFQIAPIGIRSRKVLAKIDHSGYEVLA